MMGVEDVGVIFVIEDVILVFFKYLPFELNIILLLLSKLLLSNRKVMNKL